MLQPELVQTADVPGVLAVIGAEVFLHLPMLHVVGLYDDQRDVVTLVMPRQPHELVAVSAGRKPPQFQVALVRWRCVFAPRHRGEITVGTFRVFFPAFLEQVGVVFTHSCTPSRSC